MPTQKRIRSRQALAAAMHVSLRTVHAWIAAGLPAPKRGWLLAEVQAWRHERNRAAVAARAAACRRRPVEETELRGITRTDRAPPEGDDEAEEAGPAAQARGTIGFADHVDAQLAAGVRPRTIVLEQEARRRYWLAKRERSDARRAAIAARREATAARKEAGELIEAPEHERLMIELCSAFRSTLLDFCRRVAGDLVRIETTLAAQRVLEREAEHCLQRIQERGGLLL